MGNKDKNQGQVGKPGQTDETQMGQRKPDRKQGTGQGQNDWRGQGTDDMEQGKGTDRPQPSGTTPLERDQRPINQSR